MKWVGYFVFVMSPTNGQQYQDLQATVCQNVTFMQA